MTERRRRVLPSDLSTNRELAKLVCTFLSCVFSTISPSIVVNSAAFHGKITNWSAPPAPSVARTSSGQWSDADQLKDLSDVASLTKLSRICAGVQAAKPKTSAGFSLTWMQRDDSDDGLIPISAQTRATPAKSASRRSQATKCNPASGI